MTITPDSIEGIIIVVVRWVKLGVEVFGAGLVTLGVVAVIRTGLNFFLSMEMKREKTVEKGEAELLAQAQCGGLKPQAQCASPAATT